MEKLHINDYNTVDIGLYYHHNASENVCLFTDCQSLVVKTGIRRTLSLVALAIALMHHKIHMYIQALKHKSQA